MPKILALITLIFLAGCASQPLSHNYQGEVYLQSIRIKIDPLRTEENQKEVNSGLLGDITKIQKFAESIDRAQDPVEQKKLEAQLKEFEQILVSGIREAANVPLVAPETPEINMLYDDNSELVEVRYTYDKKQGATMTLEGNIYYGSSSLISMGGGILGSQVYEVEPVLNLQVDGRNNKGEPFWQTYVSYRSNKTFRLSNEYVLGFSLDKTEESDIFLVPMAKGIVKEIEQDLKK